MEISTSDLLFRSLDPSEGLSINTDTAVPGEAYNALVEEHGQENTDNAMTNLFLTTYADTIRAEYAGTPMEDEVSALLDDALAENELPTTSAAQQDVNDVFGDLFAFYVEQNGDEMNDELMAGAGEKAKARKGAAAGGADHWLIILAKAMGAASGKHLDNAVATGMAISDVAGIANVDTTSGTKEQRAAARETNAQNAGKMAQLQAEMQASTQMFKMSNEATTTMLKTIGEGMSTMARKQ